ncbi:hypothetical protein DFH09DRAFT_1155065 [Mycena vulgaris]|nr:hypothetical protein DFH09DRAFT_1155065 [Mycena vulgaris]
MVVTRKTPVAPVPTGSRTNSSQPLPRAAKPAPKTSSSLADVEPQVAAAKNAASSQKPLAKSKHKNRHHKKAPKPARSALDILVYLGLFLLGLYAFTTCPADVALANPVCRSLSQYRTHVLEPYVLPPIYRALDHPTVAPYVATATRIERDTVRPVVLKTAAFTAPYAAAAKRAVWDAHVVPSYKAHVVPAYKKHVLPPWHTHVSPRIARAAPYAHATQRALERTAATLHKTYITAVKPFAVRVYVLTRPHVVKAYRAARPRVIALYARAVAEAGKARRAYVDPHVIRIWAKVLELSGVEPVTVPAKTEAASTAATTPKATTKAAVKEATKEAVVTPVEAISSTASAVPTPEEEIEVAASTPTASSSSSSVAPAETAPPPPAAEPAVETVAETEDVATSSSAPPPVETPPAATLATGTPPCRPGSISRSLRRSPIVQAILADLKGPAAEMYKEIIDEEEKPVAVPAPAVEPEVEAEAEDDTDDFLADLGLGDEEEEEEPLDEEDVELSPAELHELQRVAAEEQAALKLRKTAEKRADLEGRMARSNVELTALVKEKNKQLRKALVARRKAAVARLDDPASAAGGAAARLEGEGEKLFKGLEGPARARIPVERTEKWERVVGRVEEKLSEAIQGAQGALQAFHVEVKSAEVDEGMAIIQQVKDACGQAQGDVGLDLSWLDDFGEAFQAEASEIQAGTHSHPPADPFIPRLQAAQAELAALVEAFVARIAGLRQRASAAFAGVAPVEAEDGKVSILPVPPVAPTAGDAEAADPGRVEQVAQALRDVPVEAPPHEEL